MDIAITFIGLIIAIFLYERWKMACTTPPIKHVCLIFAQALLSVITGFLALKFGSLFAELSEKAGFLFAFVGILSWFYWGTVFHREVEEDDF